MNVSSTPGSDLRHSRFESPKATSIQDKGGRASGEPAGSPREIITTPYASLRGGPHEKRQVAVNNYLLENPEIYSPSPSLLENLKGVAMKEILFAIRDLLEVTKTRNDKAPQLYACLSSSPFFDICKRVYGVGRKEDLRRTSETILLHSPVTMRDFLRAMVAAAVNEWVFDGRHEYLPSDLDKKTGVMATYESELAKRESLLFLYNAENPY